MPLCLPGPDFLLQYYLRADRDVGLRIRRRRPRHSGPADSASQATVRVEVRDAYGNFVSGASVVLTATMGTLGGSSVTTTNGVATTTFTSGSKTGTGQIAATVENVTVVGKVSLTAVKTK
ncbi:MAG: Ig-like domain-containing protein [Nitrospirae bacterium]|nr:Ig-like domain-containing protein [Nitrospirota bacterium]